MLSTCVKDKLPKKALKLITACGAQGFKATEITSSAFISIWVQGKLPKKALHRFYCVHPRDEAFRPESSGQVTSRPH